MVTPPYATVESNVTVADVTYRLKTLVDRLQYHDPGQLHEAAGVVPAYWSLFGVAWPTGLRLARAMASIDIERRRILEIGAGLGLPSLVLHDRGADVTACDVHPLAAEFFSHNLALNGLDPMPYETFDWGVPRPDLGQFDLIIASDILYETAFIDPLVEFIDHHCKADGEFILADPGRKLVGRFSKRMAQAGFIAESTFEGRMRLVHYSRYSRST